MTFKCLEKNNSIDHRVTGVVLPLGAATFLQGLALNTIVAALFICWAVGKNLSAVDIFVLRQVFSPCACVVCKVIFCWFDAGRQSCSVPEPVSALVFH